MAAEVAARGEETMRMSDSGETKRTRRVAPGWRRCANLERGAGEGAGAKRRASPEWQDEVGGKLVASRHAALTILTKLARHFRASQLC
jgi:hypothetical protein